MIILYLLHLASALWMTGVIWLIQLIHYPSFLYIREDQFQIFIRKHQSRMSWIVVAPMFLEWITLILILKNIHDSTQYFLWIFNMVALIGIWISTFAIQVPIHQKLLQHCSPILMARLIQTNWIRTILWSLRLVLILWFGMSVEFSGVFR